MLTFAEFLTTRRAALGMSMTELAQHLSVTPQYISLLEAAKCNPSRKLQMRCAQFFDEDAEYIDFLAQPMSREQKQALLRAPAALPFLTRRASESHGDLGQDDAPVTTDGEDEFIQRLFAPIRDGKAKAGSEFYARLLDEVGASENGGYRFSAKARGWADHYRATLAEQVDGSDAARPLYEELARRFAKPTEGAYPDALRLLTAEALATSYARDNDWNLAAPAFEEMAERARRVRDVGRFAEATRRAAHGYRALGRPDRVVELYEEAGAGEDVPAGVKAEFLIAQATLLCRLGGYAAALDPIRRAVRIWRLRSLDIGDRTARLISAQVLGLRCLVQCADREEARKWLGRIRSTLARVTPAELTPEEQERLNSLSNLESAAMMVQQGRWNHAWKNLSGVDEWLDATEAQCDDVDEHGLLRQRVRLLKTEVSLRRGQTGEARRSADAIMAHGPMADAVRDKGEHARIRIQLADLLDGFGEREAAERALALAQDALNPDAQGDDPSRALCAVPQIQALRDSLT